MNTKMIVTALVTLALSALATFHVALPATVNATSVVGVVMTLGSALLIVFRFYHDGASPADAKDPWKSKTVLTGLVGAAFGIAAFFNIIPPVDQSNAVDVLLAVITGAGAIFGGTASTKLA